MARGLITVIYFLLVSVAGAQHVSLVQVIGEEDEPLSGATISTSEGHFLITDAQGEAGITCSCRDLLLLVRYVGYKDFRDTVSLSESRRVIRMDVSDQVMGEVVVSAHSAESELEVPTGLLAFNLASKEHLPYLLGEQDPIKFIQTRAGISTGTDGNNGYYVRGGGVDQNAIELDHIDFYNANHLLGFFSMFNSRAIERAEFLKAGYPAQVGGRLSSTLKLYTIDPSTEQVAGSIGLGVLAVNANLQVPLIKSQSSLLVSYRRSYLDLITQNFFDEQSKIRRSTNYHFSDLIIKYYQKFGNRSSLSITGFSGGDDNDFQSSRTFSNKISWSTLSGGAVWKYMVSPATDFEVFTNISRFRQSFEAEVSSFGILLDSNIKNWKSGFNLFHSVGRHELAFGATWIQRDFRPSQVEVNTGKDAFTLEDADLIHTREWAVSIDDWYVISPKVRLGAGVRFSGFSLLGPFRYFITSENESVIDTVNYKRNEKVVTYEGLEPRLRFNYLIDSRTSLKASYDRAFQYIHLSPLSSVSLPTDLWVPSSRRIKPQNSHQLSAGYFRVLENFPFSFSVEGFGKVLLNQVEWRNGAIAGYSDSPNFDDDFVFGKGHSYGIEFSFKKESGDLTGEFNYTLSRTRRKFDAVNRGKAFPAKYDRTHDINMVGSYKYNQWVFSGLFKLASGTALTLPTAKYLIGERVISEYSTRNALRMPVYHRLDVSATLNPKNHPNSKWVFSVYNVYNRNNPYFMYFDVAGSVSDYSLDIDLEEVSLFPVLPSISYELSF